MVKRLEDVSMCNVSSHMFSDWDCGNWGYRDTWREMTYAQSVVFSSTFSERRALMALALIILPT